MICFSSHPISVFVCVCVYLQFRESGSYDAVLFCSLKGYLLRQEFSDFQTRSLANVWAFRLEIIQYVSFAVLQSSYIIHSFPETLPFAALDLMWSPYENSDPHSRP